MVSRLVAGAAALLLFPLGAARAENYRNDEFGITAELPDGVLICRARADEHDHGFFVSLQPSSRRSCRTRNHLRYIDLFAYYNVIDETATLEQYRASTCRDYRPRKCLPAPPLPPLGTGANTSARVERERGWTDIFVLTQYGKAPNQPATDPAPFVNCSVTLHTDRAHFRRDFRRLEAVLSAIRLGSPEQ